jgi:hypothetical protein
MPGQFPRRKKLLLQIIAGVACEPPRFLKWSTWIGRWRADHNPRNRIMQLQGDSTPDTHPLDVLVSGTVRTEHHTVDAH